MPENASAHPVTLPTTPPVRFAMPGKRICFWGAPASTPEPGSPGLHWRERLRQTGENTGNLFIGHGLFHNLDADQKAFFDGSLPPERFHEEFDALFIPASNFLNPALDLQGFHDYFSRTKVPMLCFGLGSQVVPQETLRLKPGTEAAIRLIAERSGAIGVRGAFTADLMWGMGIRNLLITGCPSLLNLSAEAMDRLATARPSLDRIVVNYSNNVRRHSFDGEAQRDTENALFQRALGLESFYVLQNETAEFQAMDLLHGGDRALGIQGLEHAARQFGVSPSDPDVRSYLMGRMRVHFNVAPWVSMMRTMTACVGTRFHGNIAAILAGTPGLILVHDMRTLEMAELLAIPHLILDRPFSAEEVLERVLSLDYTPFLRRLNAMRGQWRMLAEMNGVGVA